MSTGRALVACALVVGWISFGPPARATDDAASLFQSGVAALGEGRPADAIASLEALADRGVVDAAASYDRGLAYAMRVRLGGELPGDLGRAAHGFEEAKELTRDPRLAADASRALLAVRSEIARRRARAGEPAEVEASRGLARAVTRLLGEDRSAALAALSAAVLGLGLFVRWLAKARRLRVSGGIAAGLAAPLLAVACLMTAAARHDREHLREGVIVTANARPTDTRGIAVPGATPLPEGARVELVENDGALARVRLGDKQAWIGAQNVRPLAAPP